MRITLLMFFCCSFAITGNTQLILRPDVVIPEIPAFKPLPAPDPDFSCSIAELVAQAGLDELTPAAQNPDNEDEYSSICVVDISNINKPRVGGWNQKNFIYPASAYKLYVLGEAIRQVVEGRLSLDGLVTVKEHNVRSDSHLGAGQVTTVSEVLRYMMT